MFSDANTAYIRPPRRYDDSRRAGNPSTGFAPDESADRFCLLGPAQAHAHRREALRDLGVDQFAVPTMHDAKQAW
ncbi:hypothetical protein ACIQ7Q_22615 [Streptomyces sp. NPDC096176]|uniref:hypothetical protein n=1 Tax=Streptomyces sp. NPDC096176 TaxID=3366079 RepID=UPI00380E64A1